MTSILDYSLILPCYNEGAHFFGSVADILSSLSLFRYRYEVIFVDDGSTDGTKRKIGAVCKKNSQCRYVFHPENKGRGAAVATGIRSANAGIVGYMDIDGEVSALYMPRLVEFIRDGYADVVVGKRVYRTSFSSLIREMASVGYHRVANFLFHTQGIDTESGYKCFRKKVFLPVLETIKSTHWFWDTESIVLSQRQGLVVKEVPVLFIRRRDKPSSVRLLPDTISYCKHMWELYWRLKKRV